ncbi:hypothetical protein A3D11_03745 [Candidatus Peribacteria bacterium RIFCSPHIGHO2_02_FULL_49_16]|nr:MAG: hypothetical protein A2880_04705 [Candidatus Peribacteria bacterium RIFCSPHIGHO2_01_FULL_49_38]OGJ58847.1 MAG: hypothetical protein A3D11_03745 [Candidatus Peribacteria bacterium RIFCSPHIGHO2_02_FULL_49_16]
MTEICPVCGAEHSALFMRTRDMEYCTSDHVYEYRRCTTCDSVYLPDPPTDRLAEMYPPNYYSFGGQHHRSWIERIKSRIERRLFRRILRNIPDSSLRVLDIGGGSGWLLSEVRACDRRVTESHIVDIDPNAKPIAENAGHIYHCRTIEEFQSTRQFHFILLLNLLEHVADPVTLLGKLHSLLTSDGLLLIKTPNADTIDARLFGALYWGGLHAPRHFVLFTKKSFLRAVRQSGLVCEKFWYTQGAPQWACSVLGSLALKGWISVSKEHPMYCHPLYTPLLAVFAFFDFLRRPFSPTTQMMAILKKH